MTTSYVELDQRVTAAHAAYESARGASLRTRAGWLQGVADALADHADELVELAGRETHLGQPRLRGELQRTVFQLRLLTEEVTRGHTLDATVDHADASWAMGPRPDLRRVNVPLGVVGVFGASNFPFAFSVMGGDTASALAAGCSVVHKVHEAHPELGMRTAEIVVDALGAAPAGLFSVVTGRSAGEWLIDHELVTAVGFTGSTHVGRLLFDRACSRPRPIPFYGELGSINPVFVTERAWAARQDQILDEFVGSFTLGMGQFCTKPGLLFVPHLSEDAVRVVQDRIAAAPMAAMLSDGLAEGFGRSVTDMRTETDVRVIVAGALGNPPGVTLLTLPAAAVQRNPAVLGREMFGPASIVVEHGSDGALPELAALLDGQLTCSIQAEPGEDLSELIAVVEARAGRLTWNGWPTGVTVSYAQHHGGPYPATTAPGATSVGTAAVRRFQRVVAFQGFPDEQLPAALQERNPLGIIRRVNGEWVRPLESGGSRGQR